MTRKASCYISSASRPHAFTVPRCIEILYIAGYLSLHIYRLTFHLHIKSVNFSIDMQFCR